MIAPGQGRPKRSSIYVTPLIAELLGERRGIPQYRLREDLVVYWQRPGNGWTEVLRIHAGRVSDLASVPRPFWWLIPPSGLHAVPAMVHDELYCTQPVSRWTADSWFRTLMIEHGVPRWRTWVMWAAVRCFGWRSWRRVAADNGACSRAKLVSAPRKRGRA